MPATAPLLAVAGWALLWAAAGHLRDLDGLGEVVRGHGLVRPVAVVVPALVAAEVGLGAAAVAVPFVAPGSRPAQAAVAAAVAALFTAFAAYLAAVRRTDAGAPCGCHRDGLASRAAVGRTAALAGCSALAALLALTGVGAGTGDVGASALAVVAAAGAAGYLALHVPDADLEAST